MEMLSKINNFTERIKAVLFSKDYKTRFQNTLEIIGKILFLLIVFSVCASQVSTFVDFNLNKINYFLILILFILFLFLNYKETLLMLVRVAVLSSPLLAICLISKFINHSAIFPEMVIMTLTSFVMFSLAFLSRKLFYKNDFKFFCYIYLIGCIFFILFAFLFDWNTLLVFGNGTYSYFSKNSAAPMLCCGLIFIPYLFSTHSWKTIIAKFVLYGIFLTMILLLRCRSVIICLPIIFVYNIFKRDHNSNEKWIWILFLVIAIAVVFVIPQLRNMIIGSFVQSASGGTSIDDISSGRFTQLFNAFEGFRAINIFFGKGSGYIDIMPAFLFCNFGLLGLAYYAILITLIFYLAVKSYKSITKDILIILLIFYFINSFFEAYGIFGPGAKVFALWSFFGYSINTVKKPSKLLRKTIDLDLKTKKMLNKLKFCHIQFFLFSLFSLILVINSTISNASIFIGESVYSFIPRNGMKYQTVSAESVDIDVEKTGAYKTIEMFVGEKKNLSATVLPSETLDKKLYWGTYQPGILHINQETGEVTALNSGYAAVVCMVNNKRNVFDDSLRINVKNGDGIASSVDLVATSSLNVRKNESVVFEANVFPNYLDKRNVTLKCNIPSYVAINNETSSIVPLVNNVSFDVWGEFVNSDSTITESNRITVTVGDEALNICEKIELPEITKNLYEKETFELHPNFTADSDNKFKLLFDDKEVRLDGDNKIEFLKSGKISITLISTFDPLVRCSKILSVLDNKLVDIKCSDNWSIVGRLNKINVEFIYESGLIRTPSAREFKMTVSGDKYAEAVSDSYEYFAKVAGTFSGRIISTFDNEIYTWYEITNHSLTKEKYKSVITILRCTVEAILVLIASILVLFFFRFKNKTLAKIIRVIILLIFQLLSIVFSIFMINSIACLIFLSIMLVSLGVWSFFIKKEPIEYECDYIKFVWQKDDTSVSSYEISI